MITIQGLFGYQLEALNLLIEAFRTRAVALVVMATGLGKTIVAAFWAKSELKKKRRGLFLCHENEILKQNMGEFRKVIGDKAVFATFFGIGEDKDFDADKADIIFASFQSFSDWKIVFPEDWFDFIIVDESHHGQAPTFKEVIQYFKPKKLLGITATPDREDMKDIREIFGEEVVNCSLEEAIANGWLTQVEYHILNDNLSHWKLKKIIKGVLEEGQRVSVKQINESIFIKKRDEEIARTIQAHAGSSKKVIIFCERTEHADNFQKYLPGSLAYHSKVKGGRKEKQKRLNAFREGSLQYILAVNQFNEGIDVPDAEVIVFLRCTDSKIIFFQQLGRGLRKIFGKEKVIVLDFVANCERLAMVKEMAHQVKEFAGNNFILNKELLHVSGSNFDFVFSDEQVEILDLVKRINEPFYETWQEASKATRNIKKITCITYRNLYKQDPCLPSNPNSFYKDFPGWTIFLGRSKKSYYRKCEEAGLAARKLGAKSRNEYRKKFSKDPMLPPSPEHTYEDFPGWVIFLGKTERAKRKRSSFYKKWEEASKAAVNLNISSRRGYAKNCHKDPMLPSNPNKVYSNFPSWLTFLGREKNEKCKTWQEASKIAINDRVENQRDYKARYKKISSKLPSHPDNLYSDFPGWDIFLGGEKKNFYERCKDASEATIKLGISNNKEYKRSYKLDSRLPSNPNATYKDFPGWKKFLGKK